MEKGSTTMVRIRKRRLSDIPGASARIADLAEAITDAVGHPVTTDDITIAINSLAYALVRGLLELAEVPPPPNLTAACDLLEQGMEITLTAALAWVESLQPGHQVADPPPDGDPEPPPWR
jgi:hypothetical protein